MEGITQKEFAEKAVDEFLKNHKAELNAGLTYAKNVLGLDEP